MLSSAIRSNTSIRVLENTLRKFDIEMSDRQKAILSILIPGILYRDGKIIILSATINKINKELKKRHDSLDFVSYLLGFDIITHIDKFGAITIPIAVLLNKVNINKEVVTINGVRVLRKPILQNATSTLIVSDLLTLLNIPKSLSLPLLSVIFDLIDSHIDEDCKTMISSSIAFKGSKFSDVRKELKEIELTRIILNAMILSVINYVGLNIGNSLILVAIVNELIAQVKVAYKVKTAKGFLK